MDEIQWGLEWFSKQWRKYGLMCGNKWPRERWYLTYLVVKVAVWHVVTKDSNGLRKVTKFMLLYFFTYFIQFHIWILENLFRVSLHARNGALLLVCTIFIAIACPANIKPSASNLEAMPRSNAWNLSLQSMDARQSIVTVLVIQPCCQTSPLTSRLSHSIIWGLLDLKPLVWACLICSSLIVSAHSWRPTT